MVLVVKNLHANAGNVGLTPAPGRPHIPTERLSHVLKRLSPRCGACELQLLKSTCPRARGLQHEKPEHCN